MVCADEKTAIQALERMEPDLPVHGTCCLTAALFVHTGQVLGLITPNRPSEVFTQFLDLLHTHPDGRGHGSMLPPELLERFLARVPPERAERFGRGPGP